MSRRFAFVLLVVLVGTLATLLWFVPVEPQTNPPEPDEIVAQHSPTPDAPPSASPQSPVTVYFEGEDARLHVERRAAPAASDPTERIRVAVEELLRGPTQTTLIRNFPEGSKVRAVFLAPIGHVTIDLELARDQVAAYGSHVEWMCLQSLAATVLAAAPNDVRGVFVTIAGTTPETFAGHVALDEPLKLDPDLFAGSVPSASSDSRSESASI